MNQSFACPTCNAPLVYDGRSTSVRCDYCGTVVIVPETMRTSATKATPGSSAAIESVPAEVIEQKQRKINEIMELVRAGRQIEATQLYHQTYNVSLKEAKQTVDGLIANHRQSQKGSDKAGKGRLSSLLGSLFGSDEG